MRVYFLAERTCALFVGGLYLGVIDGFERTTELDPKDRIFCEVKSEGRLPVCFYFDERFLIAPPPQIKLYFLKNAVAVYIHGLLQSDPSPRVLCEERAGGLSLRLVMQGRLFLDFSGNGDTKRIALPDYLETAAIHFIGNSILLESAEGFAILTDRGNLTVASEGKVLERDGKVRVEIPFRDSMGHSAACTYENGKLTACSIRTRMQPTEATFAAALFESVLIDADTLPFLGDHLAEKAASLKEFLGAFLSVVFTEQPDRVGLVYYRRPQIYDVRYLRVTLSDGRIDNIIWEE